MPKFSANLTMLFNEVDFLGRFARAQRVGFAAVEYMSPYDWPKEQLAEMLEVNGLLQILHNLPAGDWAAGEREKGGDTDGLRFTPWNAGAVFRATVTQTCPNKGGFK